MSIAALILVFLIAGSKALAVQSGQDWPCWRGVNHDGHALGSNAPIAWSETSNITWKVTVPGRGHSSPIVVGQRIFLTTSDEQEQSQSAICFDRRTGKQLWSTLVHRGGFMPHHPQNSQASATAACDGQRVFTVFLNTGKLHVSGLDLDGRKLWQSEIGPYGLVPANEGYGSSPVLYRDLVIVNGDNRAGGFIAAFNGESGRLVWRKKRPALGSFGTPIVATVAGRAQLLLSGQRTVDAYDPMTGKHLWWCQGTGEATANTVAFSEQCVFASGGAPEKDLLCVRADGSGDVAKSHVVWRTNRGVAYVPSLLYHDSYLYVLTDAGIARCLDASSGKVIWENRLGGTFKASPVLQADRIYVCNETGQTYVFRVGSNFQLLAENSLQEGAFASLAICQGQIFLRTFGHLYCIEQKTDRTPATIKNREAGSGVPAIQADLP